MATVEAASGGMGVFQNTSKAIYGFGVASAEKTNTRHILACERDRSCSHAVIADVRTSRDLRSQDATERAVAGLHRHR